MNCRVILSTRHCSQYRLSAFQRPLPLPPLLSLTVTAGIKHHKYLKTTYFCLIITTWPGAYLLPGLCEKPQSSIPTCKLKTLLISYVAHNHLLSSFPCLMGGEHLSSPLDCKYLWGQIYFYITHSTCTCSNPCSKRRNTLYQETLDFPVQQLVARTSAQGQALRTQESAGALGVQKACQPHRCSCHLRVAGSWAHSHNTKGSVCIVNWGISLHQRKGLRECMWTQTGRS